MGFTVLAVGSDTDFPTQREGSLTLQIFVFVSPGSHRGRFAIISLASVYPENSALVTGEHILVHRGPEFRC